MPASSIDSVSTTSFDFLREVDDKYVQRDLVRLDLRKRFVIDANIDEIRGKGVLDLASHDGRWAFAFAAAGASAVVGVEARQHLVETFRRSPNSAMRSKIKLHHSDLFAFLESEVHAKRQYDVVAALGIFYHIMDHYRLLRLIHKLRPGLVIVDGDFLAANWAYIGLAFEDPEMELNSTASNGEDKVPIGIPSTRAMERMAECLGYSVQWADWNSVPEEERGPVGDYYRPGARRAMTCMLRPLE